MTRSYARSNNRRLGEVAQAIIADAHGIPELGRR
jgi:hypothetical protein